MAVTVKQITLWRTEVDNKPGMLARVLGPLAAAGADLRVAMAYRFPGNESRAAIEVFPVTGRKQIAAAQSAGLSAAEFPALLVEGDNKPGLGERFARAIADQGINMSFLVGQTIGRKYTSVFGFETKEQARAAASVIRKAAKR